MTTEQVVNMIRYCATALDDQIGPAAILSHERTRDQYLEGHLAGLVAAQYALEALATQIERGE